MELKKFCFPGDTADVDRRVSPAAGPHAFPGKFDIQFDGIRTHLFTTGIGDNKGQEDKARDAVHCDLSIRQALGLRYI